MSESFPVEPRNQLHQLRCKRCNATPRLLHEMLNVKTGGALCMYKCECGEPNVDRAPEV